MDPKQSSEFQDPSSEKKIADGSGGGKGEVEGTLKPKQYARLSRGSVGWCDGAG